MAPRRARKNPAAVALGRRGGQALSAAKAAAARANGAKGGRPPGRTCDRCGQQRAVSSYRIDIDGRHHRMWAHLPCIAKTKVEAAQRQLSASLLAVFRERGAGN